MHGIRPIWADDHIRERYGLLTIIVLGESMLAVSTGKLTFDATTMVTASLAFLAAVSIWWTYFDGSSHEVPSGKMSVTFVWGYAHFAIFAGIAAVGVGAEPPIEAAGQSDAAALVATEPLVVPPGETGPAASSPSWPR